MTDDGHSHDDRLDRDVDDELRRLFADDRLALPVAVDATRTVIAGARRRRRSRLAGAAAAGVLGVAALVFAATSLAGLGRAPGPVTAANAPLLSTTQPTSPTGRPVPTGPNVLGPDGVGEYRLGMSVADLLRRGIVHNGPVGKAADGSECVEYTVLDTAASPAGPPLATAPAAPPVSTPASTPATTLTATPSTVAPTARPLVLTVLVTSAGGTVVQVGGSGDLHTPEGVTIGESYRLVDRLYGSRQAASGVPSLKQGRIEAPVPGADGVSYVFDLDARGTVTAMWVRSTTQPSCLG